MPGPFVGRCDALASAGIVNAPPHSIDSITEEIHVRGCLPTERDRDWTSYFSKFLIFSKFLMVSLRRIVRVVLFRIRPR